MSEEYIFCAVDSNDDIQTVMGSSKNTRYFKTDKYLNRAVGYHNKHHPDNLWRVRRFKLTPTLHEVERFENLMYDGCESHWHCVYCDNYWPFHCYNKDDLEKMICPGREPK